jgi:drug/metabolite transporter (DMT)-like permease
VFVGLLLAVASALGTNASFLLKARGAIAAPPVQVRHLVRSAVGLFRSRWFAIGWLVAVGAWLLHVGALALAPLSITQAVLSGGLVFLAVLAERFFGFRLRRRQWIGITVTAIGLAIIGLTGTGSRRPEHASLAALISVECSVFALGALLVSVSMHRHVKDRPESLMLGIAAGALFGVSDIAIKYLTGAHQPLFGLLSPWTLSALLAAVVSFYASARSLQLGQPVEVIALTSVAANLAAIIGGVLVFHESIGVGPLHIAGRMLAFCLVIAGAAMMPAPLRAASRSGDSAMPGGRSRPSRSPSRRRRSITAARARR